LQVIHRDLKPANVILDRGGQALVTDFGMAKDLEATSAAASAAGALTGTPAYCSPEQARGEGDAGPSTDVYGLGATFYALLTGEPPFKAESLPELLIKITQSTPATPGDLLRGIDPTLDEICLRCLHKTPSQRYASVAELCWALEAYLKKGSAPALAQRKSGGLNPWTAGALGSVLTLVALAVPAGLVVRALGETEGEVRQFEFDALEQKKELSAANTLWENAEARARAEKERNRETSALTAELQRRIKELEVRDERMEKEIYRLREVRTRPPSPRTSPSAPVSPTASGARRAANLHAQAAQYVRQRKPKEAILLLTQAIKADPSRVDAYVDRAFLKLRIGDSLGAVADCNEALRLDRGHSMAWNNRAQARRALGNDEGAFEDAAQAVKADPKNVNAHITLAGVAMGLKRFGVTLSECDAALALLSPTDGRRKMVLGWRQRSQQAR
jgi:tetratricopeptide (TPR) repeat protein